MYACKCCSKQFEEHKMAVCCICKDKFYHQCVDLTSTEVRAIKIKPNLSWSCSECTKMGNNLIDLKSLIVSLKREIEELKAKITSNTSINTSSNDSSHIEKVIQEVNERNARKSNLVVYGLPETTGDPSNDKAGTDKEAVIKILQILQPNIDFNTVSPFRLGKFDPSKPNPRPIKVKLASEELLYACLKNGKKLKSNREYSQIVVSNDRTPLQQEDRARRRELQ